MPYEKRPAGDGKYEVVNTQTGHVKGSDMTSANADAQLKLLNAIEHGFTPTRRHPHPR